MRITIQPYNPVWPRTFSQIQSARESLLRAHSVPFHAVEHVGSTAVPGLAAKPIIDIDVIVTASALGSTVAAITTFTTTPFAASLPPVPVPVPAAVGKSYNYIGERGIPGRHALREPGFEGGGDEARHTPNVYVCVEGCLVLRNHLAVRDTLRREYEGVKWAAAEREWESMEG